MIVPIVFGILNITEDSFSDGGKFLDPGAALAKAEQLIADGADAIDIGAASSRPDAELVPSDVEILRLAPVMAALKQKAIPISVDTFAPEVQRWAMNENVDYLNDVRGFPFVDLYPELAASKTKLIVMHSVEGLGPATRIAVPPSEIFDRILRFFEMRIAALERAGVARERLILDPGMGMFLGNQREASFVVLRRLPELKAAFGLPLLISVSRKSFLRGLVGRDPGDAGATSLAAELFALDQGASLIRTHVPGAIKDAAQIWGRLTRDRDA